MLRRALFAAVFCCAFIAGHQAFAESPLNHGEQINLFALPLKEVLEIRVDGGSSSLTSNRNISIFDADQFTSELKSLEIEDQSALNSPSLVLIDGHSIERINSLSRVEDYLSYLGTQVARVEVYKGRYTRYLSSRRVRTVVNIVTTTGKSEEASQ